VVFPSRRIWKPCGSFTRARSVLAGDGTVAFGKLTTSAKTINDVSNELAKHVASLGRALDRLNVGVACWAKISGGSEGYDYWRQDVGYSQVKR
jgi:hypothetical protein